MTELAHAVNFTMSFGCTVLPEDINKMREWLEKSYTIEYLWDMEINKNSSDKEIANYLGVENYRDHFLTEAMELEMQEHHVYDEKDTKRLRDDYQRRLKDFRKANKINKTKRVKNDL